MSSRTRSSSGACGQRTGSALSGASPSTGTWRAASTVYVKKGAHILGDVIAHSIVLHEEAKIDGTITAPHGMRIERGV